MRSDLLPASGTYADIPIGEVLTEAGASIPETSLRLYAFYDAAERAAVPTPPEERPIILIEHALTGDGNAADWWADMVGVGKPIDTAKYLVLCANALGGCAGSTGPSSLHPEGGFWGSRFPGLSIRDLVQAEKQLLDVLEIPR
ncbi:MAG TPA: homoserine O-acetyltransferase, partial [Corynebacterium urealyticum]|nr:homoserine O-acetyltransferase [Corynebacterium urealyticum]